MTPDETDAPSSGARKVSVRVEEPEAGSRWPAAPISTTCG